MPVNIVNNTDSIKRQDNITPIEVLLTDDNNANYPIDGKTVKAWFSNETGFLYEKELTERDGQKLIIRIDPDEVNKIGIGKIKMEIVVEESDRQKIFPNGSYIEFEIVRNLKSINGTALNPITLEFFEREFDDLKLVADAATQRANDAAKIVEDLAPTIAELDGIADRAETAATNAENTSAVFSELTSYLENLQPLIINIIDFPKNEGESDDTGRIKRAIESIVNSGQGGVINFPPGIFISSPFILPYKVVLKGSGIDITTLKMANNSNDNFVTLNQDSLYAGIFDMTVDGNKDNNNSGNGVHIESTAHVSLHVTLNSVRITRSPNNNLFISRYNYVINILNIELSWAGSYGFYNVSSDNTFVGVNSFSNARAGIYENGVNNRWVAGKMFYNNQSIDYQNEGAIMVAGSKRSIFINVEAQENRGHGFVVSNCNNVSLIGCLADCNGITNENATTESPLNKDGFQVRNQSSNIQISSSIADDFRRGGGQGTYKPAQRRSLYISADSSNISADISESNQNESAVIENKTSTVKINSVLVRENKTIIRSYVSSALNLPAGSSTKITFQTNEYDLLSEMVTGTFTAKNTGIYLVDVGLFFPSQTDGNVTQIELYKNNAEERRLARTYAEGNGTHFVGGVATVRLNKGETLDVRCFVSNASSIDPNSKRSFLEITSLTSM